MREFAHSEQLSGRVFISCTPATRGDRGSQSGLCTSFNSHWLQEKQFTQEAWVKNVHESAECIKISLRALVSKAEGTTLLTFKWAKWKEPGHHWSQGYLWHPPVVKVFQSLRFPMLGLSINTPSTAAPGLSIIFCQRCCSSPWESIQSTSLPLLTPENCKNMREFAILGSSLIISLLVCLLQQCTREMTSTSHFHLYRELYWEQAAPGEHQFATELLQAHGQRCINLPTLHHNFFLALEEWILTSSSSHHHQQKGWCWAEVVDSFSLGC